MVHHLRLAGRTLKQGLQRGPGIAAPPVRRVDRRQPPALPPPRPRPRPSENKEAKRQGQVAHSMYRLPSARAMAMTPR